MFVETKIRGLGPHKYNNLTIKWILRKTHFNKIKFFLQNMHVHVAHYKEGNEINTM